MTHVTEPGFGVDAASTNERLDRWAEAIAAKAERYTAMQQEVQATTASEQSADGSVSVTVDSGGAIVDLRFTDELKRLPTSRMAEVVLTTMRRAQARIADQVAEIVQTRVGDDPETAAAMTETFRQRFPQPDPETATDEDEWRIGDVEESEEDVQRTERPPSRSRRTENGDDDEFGGPVLNS